MSNTYLTPLFSCPFYVKSSCLAATHASYNSEAWVIRQQTLSARWGLNQPDKTRLTPKFQNLFSAHSSAMYNALPPLRRLLATSKWITLPSQVPGSFYVWRNFCPNLNLEDSKQRNDSLTVTHPRFMREPLRCGSIMSQHFLGLDWVGASRTYPPMERHEAPHWGASPNHSPALRGRFSVWKDSFAAQTGWCTAL